MLGRHEVQYFRCEHCGFVQTEAPYWLDEAYAKAITKKDLGLVGRNITFATVCRALISVFFNTNAKYVDYGGGYGLFVRLMRDAGFDFFRYDKYCDNLFAEGLDVDEQGNVQYELVTAFEVFEHLAHPLDEIARMLQFSRNIFFSTELIPLNHPKPNEWSYYEPEYGQHTAFYTRQSLSINASKFHLNLYSNGKSLHLLTEKNISPCLFQLMLHRKVAAPVNLFLRRKSLLGEDVARLTQTSYESIPEKSVRK